VKEVLRQLHRTASSKSLEESDEGAVIMSVFFISAGWRDYDTYAGMNATETISAVCLYQYYFQTSLFRTLTEEICHHELLGQRLFGTNSDKRL
jgi:hypothetical protein